VTLAIAVIALVVVVGHRQRNPPATPSPAARPIPPAARPLASILGVLRRPQTAADKAAESKLLGGAADRSLVRLAAVDSVGRAGDPRAREGAHVRHPRAAHRGRSPRRRGEQQWWLDRRVDRGWRGAGRWRARAATLRAARPACACSFVVPDGVAKVVFVLPRQPVPSSVPGGPVYRHPLAVGVPVHNNVAFHSGSTASAGDGNLVTRWYAADGQLIRTTGNPTDTNRLVATPQACARDTAIPRRRA